MIVTMSPPRQLPVSGDIEEMYGPSVGIAANWTAIVDVPQSRVAFTFEVPDAADPSVTSAKPLVVTFETLGRPVSRKMPKSVVKTTEEPSGTATPFFLTVARMITPVPASGVTDVALREIVTAQVPLPEPPPAPEGEVGDSPEHPTRASERPASRTTDGVRSRRIGFTS